MDEVEDLDLDAWLAVHLFGWWWVQHGAKLADSGSSQTPGVRFLVEPSDDVDRLLAQDIYADADESVPLSAGPQAVKEWSSDGAAMLEVIDAMRGRGFDWEMHAYCQTATSTFMNGMRFTAGVSSLDAPSPYAWWAEAPTLPQAVATAARAALEATAVPATAR